MKTLLIKTMDMMAYICFGLLLFVCLLSVIGGGVVEAVIIFVVGMIALSLVFSFWAVITNILDEKKKTNALLAQMLDKMENKV